MTTLSKLNQYGNAFQVKVLGALLTQRDFLLNIADSLDSEYFESQAHKWTIEYIIKYFNNSNDCSNKTKHRCNTTCDI